MKRCTKCGKQKETTQFSKCSARKDFLQDNCKECNKVDNLKFRTQINPEHHAEWQRNNPDRLNELVKKYRKADKGGAIYSIRNPEGETYIGMTEAHLNVRWLEHRQHYNRAKKGKNLLLPKLHASFDVHGIENHTFEVVVEMPGIDRKQLRFIETTFIESFQQIGKSLNIRVR